MATDKTIRIWVDAHSFDTAYQGTQSFLYQLYNALLQHYPQLDIYMGAYHVQRIREAFPLLPVQNILPYKTLRPAALRYVTDIPRQLKKHRFHFAHFQYIAPRQQPGCRYIVTLHDVLLNDFPQAFSWGFRQSRHRLFGNSIKRAAVKTTVSGYAKGRIEHHYGLPASELHIVPNAIAPWPADGPGKEQAAAMVKQWYGIDNYLLYVSRLEPRKNHQLLLEAWLEMALYQQGIGLVWVGSVDKTAIKGMKPLLRALQNLPAAARPFFRHLPSVERPKLQALLRAARLFVYPSLAEGFGIPPLEAAAAGTPVLCSHATAMQDFTFFGEGLFNPTDKVSLREKIAAFLQAPPTDAALAAMAAEVQAKYAPQQCARLFYELLNQYLPCP
jgi:glycosyltransferase involved in cell wall biosynthesis